MKSYKVEITEKAFYIVDVQAESEQEARDKADKEFIAGNYQETGDIEVDFGTVYDVTGTDDDAFLKEENEKKREGMKDIMEMLKK